MFFDDEDGEAFITLNPLNIVVHREFFAITSNLGVLRSVPTHTEDGIPIRKLYVSNLPPKTTRTELFGVFAQYGFIKSCWLRMGDRGPDRTPTPTYAFVTYSNPADAHKALQAPNHEKMLRGRILRISPADSWHQPAEDAEGRVLWKPRGHVRGKPDEQDEAVPETSTENAEDNPEIVAEPEEQMEETDTDYDAPYTILDILNQDCLNHVLSYVPVRDLIRSEVVSKRWQAMVQEYIQGMRTFKTSWWQHTGVTLTTAVLRRVLQRLGGSLHTLHIDHHWSALNDRTAHSVGKFCPHLEELKVVGMHTKNWNPLVYGCKQLKNLSFVSCNKLTDTSLVHLVKNDSCIESIMVANNTHVTGLFLTGSTPANLSSLAFYNCYSLQGTVLTAALENLHTLTALKLDLCPMAMWKIVPKLLIKLPQLEELSLSEYASAEHSPYGNEELCEAFATLTELKILNLSRNIFITNGVLKQVSQSCPKLQDLNVSGCNSTKTSQHLRVSDEGLALICKACTELERLDISYLGGLSDSGLAAIARCRRLEALVAQGNPNITAVPLQQLLAACTQLRELDLSGCNAVSDEVVEFAVRALNSHPRQLSLYIAGTLGAGQEDRTTEFPRHPLLCLDTLVDRHNPQLRPDFVDRMFDESSDDSFDDLYDHDDFDDFFRSDDDFFVEDDDMDDYYDFGYGHGGENILLL